MRRWFLALFFLILAAPVMAQEMTADEARKFVIGKTFAFSCFEGSKGTGRILSDGSAIGTLVPRGQGLEREATIPSGTLFVEEDQVCAQVQGASFKPCFTLTRMNQETFRGHLTGYENLYCEFQRIRTTAEIDEGVKVLRPKQRATAALEKPQSQDR